MAIKFEITEARSGAAFTVRVVTRASNVEIAGVQEDGSLKIRLTEAHADGAADQQLRDFLADRLNIEVEQIEIVAGENSRNKLVSIEGLKPHEVEAALELS